VSASRPVSPWRRRTICVVASSALFVAGVAATAPAASAAPANHKAPSTASYAAGQYIVTFADEPAASYEGNVKGYARTRPDSGKKVDPTRSEVATWRSHLTAEHDKALSAVGASKLADYTVATNGVAVTLTSSQARALAAVPGVVRLQKDAMRKIDTTASPEFLGLTGPTGLWSKVPGGAAAAGKGVIVGVIDTGIWPESPSFAGSELKRDKAGQPVAASGLRGTWFGPCVQGEQFSSQACNDKLIGARYYVAGFGTKNISKAEYLSPRDGDGHGSHTASTAAGNHVDNVTIEGRTFGNASGMAPGARLAAYKVCWAGNGIVDDGCSGSDIVAAIDDAVADGVDVINMSIGGTTESSVFDAEAQAFRRASNAGVFVANSAGNSGPGASTLDHPAPWVTSVAASTFRISEAALELGNGHRYVGASITNGLPAQTALVTATAVKLAAATADDARRCFAGTLDPAKAAGKVVVCDRGVSDRVAKSAEVKRAGGAAMVLTNFGQTGLSADLHSIPSIHVEEPVRTEVLAYIASTPSPTAAIKPVNPGESTTQVPEVADFSSRGPSTTTQGDILKPDLAAPGVDVLAAVAPPFHLGRSYDFMSGTSMASPHVAGLGALLKAAHPTWTPAMVKSALMTTGRDHATSHDPFAQGAGFVRPNSAVDPGLVFDAAPNDYRRFMIGQGGSFAAPYDTLTAIDASDLNQASIATGAMAGQQVVTRTVTSVGAATEHYTVSSSVPGITISSDAPSFDIAPGAAKVLHLTMTRDTAALGTWAKGNLTITGDHGHVVRLPVAVRPVAISAPVELSGTGTSGERSFSVTPGFTGTLDTSVAGLLGATPTSGTVATGAFDADAPAAGPGTKAYTVPVPAGTGLARFDVDATATADDLDLYVYKDGELVGVSASGAADERVTLSDPEPGAYTAYVNGYATGGGGGFAYTQWSVPSAPLVPANLTVDDNVPMTIGQPSTLTAHWSGLLPGLRYLGYIQYGAGPERTIVSVG
jgi:subtilisin family serine protease